MEKHWSVQEVKNAKEWTIQTVSSYSNEDRSTILTNYAILTDAWAPHCSPSSNKPKAINRCCKHELVSVCNCKRKWSTINPSRNLEVASAEASHCQICCSKNRITIKHWIRFSTFTVSTSVPPIEPAISKEEKERVERAKDLVIVTDEFERYICTGVLQSDKADNLDLDLHWEVRVWFITWS